MTDLTLTTERTIKAPQQAVFDAWLNPELLAQFMRPRADMTVPVCKSDAVQGGNFEILMRVGDNDIPHSGTYKKIDPHKQIVFTWETSFSADDSTVTLDFAPADGGTHVTLTHVRFPSEESRDNHMAGWSAILSTLDTTLMQDA